MEHIETKKIKERKDNLRINIIDQVSRIKGNKASMIIIDGGVGEGKTTLGVMNADIVNETKGLPPIELPGPQYAYGGVDFTRKLNECYDRKLPVIIYDEAGDFNRRGSMSKFNALLNRTFETFRTFKIMVIMILPTFKVIDQDIFDKQIPRLLLHCQNRTNKRGYYKGYSLYRMHYIRKNMDHVVVKAHAYSAVRPNFSGTFQNLPAERAKQLDRISTKEKKAGLLKSSLHLEGLLSLQELMRELGRSKGWIFAQFRAANIQPSRRSGRRFYYNEDVLTYLHAKLAQATQGRK